MNGEDSDYVRSLIAANQAAHARIEELEREVVEWKGPHADGSDSCGCWKCVAYRIQASCEQLVAERDRLAAAVVEETKKREALGAECCVWIDSHEQMKARAEAAEAELADLKPVAAKADEWQALLSEEQADYEKLRYDYSNLLSRALAAEARVRELEASAQNFNTGYNDGFVAGEETEHAAVVDELYHNCNYPAGFNNCGCCPSLKRWLETREHRRG